MLEQCGLQVLIKAGTNGHKLRTLASVNGTRNNEFIEVFNGVPVCVSVKILKSFRWADANALSMQVKLGTVTTLLPQRILKPVQPSDVKLELEKWNIWDLQKEQWVATQFQFCDLIYIDGAGGSKEEHVDNLGTIAVSFKRIRILQDDTKHPWPRRRIDIGTKQIRRSQCVLDPRCYIPYVSGLVSGGRGSDLGRLAHSISVSSREVLHNVESFDIGTVKSLDTKVGSNWVHFQFHYRSQGMMNGAVRLLRSLKPNELTQTQTSALKPWLSKRNEDDEGWQGRPSERRESRRLSSSISSGSAIATERPTERSDNVEQRSPISRRAFRWGPPHLSVSESGDDEEQLLGASANTHVPKIVAQRYRSLPNSTPLEVGGDGQGLLDACSTVLWCSATNKPTTRASAAAADAAAINAAADALIGAAGDDPPSFADDTIVALPPHGAATVVPATSGGKPAEAPQNTRTVGPGTALPYYCARGTLHSSTARRMWHSLEAHVLSNDRGCRACRREELPCVVSGGAQCLYCTAMGYSGTRKCSLAGTGRLGGRSHLLAASSSTTSSGGGAPMPLTAGGQATTQGGSSGVDTPSMVNKSEAATVAIKPGPQIAGPSAATSQAPPRSPSVEIIDRPAVKVKREYILIDNSTEQGNPSKIEELKAKRARLDREIRLERMMAERDALDEELAKLQRHG